MKAQVVAKTEKSCGEQIDNTFAAFGKHLP